DQILDDALSNSSRQRPRTRIAANNYLMTPFGRTMTIGNSPRITRRIFIQFYRPHLNPTTSVVARPVPSSNSKVGFSQARVLHDALLRALSQRSVAVYGNGDDRVRTIRVRVN